MHVQTVVYKVVSIYRNTDYNKIFFMILPNVSIAFVFLLTYLSFDNILAILLILQLFLLHYLHRSFGFTVVQI